MQIPKLFIVADRGEAKLFRFEHNGGRPSSFHLHDSFSIEEAHQRHRDRFTDQAGSFPNNASHGQGNSVAERQTLVLESDRRIIQSISEKIDQWLDNENSPSWAFSAPAEINASIIGRISSRHRKYLHQNLHQDLTHLPPGKLIDHLEAVSPSDIV